MATSKILGLGHEHCLKYQALPIKREKSHLWVALSDPENTAVIADLSDITGMNIMPIFVNPEEIRIGINRLFAASENEAIENTDTIHFIDSVIETGIANRASDIHIEPYHNCLRVRYRVDGHLHTYNSADISLLAGAISHLKIKGGMDISEKRRPQDGRFSLRSENFQKEKIEFRISILPTVFGEKAAIRILYDNTALIKKTDLGFFPEDLERLTALLKRPYGAVFVTGPTGSGKSTTLSSFLEELNTELVNIVTVEDPVENPIPGVNHIAAESGASISFAHVLRNILRQDPDIIMIGEIRDEDTARIAIQAAITGHIVLSTLHTNDAAGVIERLLDMGIEPYLAASALNGVISQRLVRRICENCKQPAKLSAAQAKLLDINANMQVFKGRGCDACLNTGYRGRLAVYEIIVLDDHMRRQISESPYPFAVELRSTSTFKKTALRHLIAGNTDADEIVRIIAL